MSYGHLAIKKFQKYWQVNVQNSRLITSFIFAFLSLISIGRAEVDQTVDELNNLNRLVREFGVLKLQGTCFSHNPQSRQKLCPKILLEEIRNNNSGGIVGLTNKLGHYLFNETDLSTPNTVCPFTPNPKQTLSLNQKIRNLYTEIEFNCEAEFTKLNLSGIDLERTRDFITSSIVDKTQRISDNTRSLLQAQHQINLLLNDQDKEFDCRKLNDSAMMEKCLELSTCPNQNSDAFKHKAATLFEMTKSIIKLNQQKRKAPKDQIESIDKTIEAIYDIYPLLKSKELKSLQKRNLEQLTSIEVTSALRNDLIRTRKTVHQELVKANHAYSCLTGTHYQCDDFEEIVAKNFDHHQNFSQETSAYYQCLEMVKENRNQTNDILGDVTLSAALSFTPGIVVQAGRLAYSGGNLIRNTLALEKLNANAIKLGVLLDSGFAINEISKIKSACEEKLHSTNQIESRLTCHSEKDRLTQETDLDACTEQMISASVSALAPGLGVAAIKWGALPKLSPIELSEIESQINKIPQSAKRATLQKDVHEKLKALQEAKENYSAEEIKAAIKLFIKKCE